MATYFEDDFETSRVGGQMRMEKVASGGEVSCVSESEHVIRYSTLRNGSNSSHRSIGSEIGPCGAVVLDQRRYGGAIVMVGHIAKFSGLEIEAFHARGKST